jgi:hypothetical protein
MIVTEDTVPVRLHAELIIQLMKILYKHICYFFSCFPFFILLGILDWMVWIYLD